LGFGTGNYNDAMAERLADAGDGNHAYIDTLLEARKVLVEEMSSTLLTIARDVKVQIEFNPAAVAEYRLVGYANRMLREEDFANDRVDAGDIGAGHEVTTLYEIALAGSGAERLPPLRYGASDSQAKARTGELAHLRLRYKQPDSDTSRLIEVPLRREDIRAQAGPSLRFAATVAAFADALRGGHNLGTWDWDAISASARGSRGDDRWGLRAEFAELVEAGRTVTRGDSDREHGRDDGGRDEGRDSRGRTGRGSLPAPRPRSGRAAALGGGRGLRVPEQEALAHGAAQLAQDRRLALGLHALTDGIDAERAGQGQD